MGVEQPSGGHKDCRYLHEENGSGKDDRKVHEVKRRVPGEHRQEVMRVHLHIKRGRSAYDSGHEESVDNKPGTGVLEGPNMDETGRVHALRVVKNVAFITGV